MACTVIDVEILCETIFEVLRWLVWGGIAVCGCNVFKYSSLGFLWYYRAMLYCYLIVGYIKYFIHLEWLFVVWQFYIRNRQGSVLCPGYYTCDRCWGFSFFGIAKKQKQKRFNFILKVIFLHDPVPGFNMIFVSVV